MSIWFTDPSLEMISERNAGTLSERLGIDFIEIGPDYLVGTMPVDHRTMQPAGVLHGGASVALAETLGSVAASLCLDRSKKQCVGLEVNANHIHGVSKGKVTGTAKPLHIGRSTHVWEIIICDDCRRTVCISRLTISVLDRQQAH